MAGVTGLAPDSEPPVEVRDLVTSFGANVIHDHLDLTAKRGEILGVVGGSGSGKSVLLSVLLGLKRPDAGEVRILGHDLYGEPPEALRAVRSRWGVLFQGGALFSNLTIRENIAAPLVEHTKLPKQTIDGLADLKIDLAGLPPEVGDMRPAELSGGMTKRAGLARALALDPELLLLDEPTSGLDPVVAAQFDRLIVELSQTLGLTVVLITHDLDSIYEICDRVAVLAEKRVLATAPVRDFARTEHPWVKAYFDGPRGRAAARAAQARTAAIPAQPHQHW